MNKLFKYFHLLLIFALTIFFSMFMFKTIRGVVKVEEYSISYQIISFCIFFIIYLVLNIKDLIKREKINNYTRYNILSCISLLVITLLIVRALYDPSFLANVKTYKVARVINAGNLYKDYFFQYNIMYIESNVLYINILFILLLIYRHINLKNTKK